MTIPDFQTVMLPLLETIADGKEHTIQDTTDRLGYRFKLSETELKELLPSGQPVFSNRVGWARTYMKKAGLVDTTRRGYFQITSRGKDILLNPPKCINVKFLEQFEDFRAFRLSRRIKPAKDQRELVQTKTPQELLELSYQELKETLTDDLLERVKKISPSLFEKLVVDLLVAMGYGGNVKDAGKAVGKVGDEGIDGTIKEDRLGLDIIYIQAKRWAGTVSRPEVQKFAGALQGKRARKGILITTSEFSREAREYADAIESKIILIDGPSLAEYMIDFNIGVSPVSSFEIKRMDTDYFES